MSEMYDFDKEINRRNTGSLKWDVPEGELPMWVADMDFETAPGKTGVGKESSSWSIWIFYFAGCLV